MVEFRILGPLEALEDGVPLPLGGGRPRALLASAGRVRGNTTRVVRFPARRLPAGSYVFAIRLRAAMNAQRTTVLVSKPFRVAAPRRKKR